MSTLSPDRECRVCLFGASLDVGNMGCRALSVSLIRLLLEANPNANISLLYGNRSADDKEVRIAANRTVRIPVVNFRLSPRARLREHLLWIFLLALAHRFLPIPGLRKRILDSSPWLKHLAEADFVGDVRGGDSFADIYGLGRFLVGVAPSLTALLMRRPFVFLPQTYGPYRSRASRFLARFTLSKARQIFSRDRASIKVLQELMGARSCAVVEFCPDVAFSLEPIDPESVVFSPPLPSRNLEVLVGLNISGLLYMGGYSGHNMFGLRCNYPALVGNLLTRLVALPGVRILLIPHSFGTSAENDQAACRQAWESLAAPQKEKVHLLMGAYDQNEIKSIIGRCDFLIASRMHACIAALSQRVPCVGIAYSRKFLGVFETAGVGDMVLDARKVSESEIVEGCLKRLKERELVTDTLRRTIPDVRSQLGECFARILSQRQ